MVNLFFFFNKFLVLFNKNDSAIIFDSLLNFDKTEITCFIEKIDGSIFQKYFNIKIQGFF